MRTAILRSLADERFDVVVVGGGVAGACAAWDATLRGMKVALVERSDFASGTSAHSLKVLHGGIRYLQHLDLRRLWESCAERGAFLRIAPHLTRPMPFAVPTRGWGMQAGWPLRAAFAALALLTPARNRGMAREQRIRGGSMLSRRQFARLFPAFSEPGITGAGVFYDGQIYNPPRLVWSLAKSAQLGGAVIANYCGAHRVLLDRARVCGLTVRDEITGDLIEVRAPVILNAAGPFAPGVLGETLSSQQAPRMPFSRDMAFVIRRPLDLPMAIAVQTQYRDPDAWVSRGNRHLFLVPWRPNATLIGVNSRVADVPADQLRVTEEEIRAFLDEINAAQPSLRIGRDEVGVVNAGHLPFGDNDEGDSDLSFGKRSHVVDHGLAGGPRGLLTGISVRWTMGRRVAERLVDAAEPHLQRPHVPSATRSTTVWGGDIPGVAQTAQAIRAYVGEWLPLSVAERLAHNYGSQWQRLLAAENGPAELLADGQSLVCEVQHAARNEMAVTLRDIVLRRTDIGTAGRPDPDTLSRCATIAAAVLGWSAERMRREITFVEESYPFATPASQRYRNE